jgi:hypothetical protein
VYKLLKDLYRLKQAPRAWYARLKTFLLESGYVMGSVDKNIFRFLVILSTHSSLGFGILLLFRLILLVFSMLILLVVGLTKRALLVLVIFLDRPLFAGLHENNLLLLNPPQRLSI